MSKSCKGEITLCEHFYACTSVFVHAQVCLRNGEPVYAHVGLCTCKCVFEHVRDSLHAWGCLCAHEGVFACASLYVCILMHIKLYLTHILSQSLSVCRPCAWTANRWNDKDNATTSMEKATKPQGKGDQNIKNEKE